MSAVRCCGRSRAFWIAGFHEVTLAEAAVDDGRCNWVSESWKIAKAISITVEAIMTPGKLSGDDFNNCNLRSDLADKSLFNNPSPSFRQLIWMSMLTSKLRMKPAECPVHTHHINAATANNNLWVRAARWHVCKPAFLVQLLVFVPTLPGTTRLQFRQKNIKSSSGQCDYTYLPTLPNLLTHLPTRADIEVSFCGSEWYCSVQPSVHSF